jgi:hypothetical protein
VVDSAVFQASTQGQQQLPDPAALAQKIAGEDPDWARQVVAELVTLLKQEDEGEGDDGEDYYPEGDDTEEEEAEPQQAPVERRGRIRGGRG